MTPSPCAGNAFTTAMNAPSPDPPEVLQREYEGDLATLRAARRARRRLVGRTRCRRRHKRTSALIVSELSSNAVQAAPGRTYSLQVRLDDGCATISVRNHPCGSQPPARESWRPEPATQLRNMLPRGRGLAIVDSLSEDVTVERHGEDVVVSARCPNQLQRDGPLLVGGLVDDGQHIRQTGHFQESPHPIVRVDQFVGDTWFPPRLGRRSGSP